MMALHIAVVQVRTALVQEDQVDSASAMIEERLRKRERRDKSLGRWGEVADWRRYFVG